MVDQRPVEHQVTSIDPKTRVTPTAPEQGTNTRNDDDDDDDDGSDSDQGEDDTDVERQETFRPHVLPKWIRGSNYVPNIGSTCRDYCARERNFLSWARLSIILAVISAAMLLRFQLGQQTNVPGYQIASEVPLGILFFVASFNCMMTGVIGHFTYDRQMRRRAGFVQSGRPTQIILWSVGLLTMATCILLLSSSNLSADLAS
ncbi:hypothetical protein ACM66B_001642 [Microbotryomycetes sp. NB124-2]